MKFLIFGDVFGELGRKGVSAVLPELREQYQPDSIIANVENIAHGKGLTPETMEEAFSWKADVYTTGDHAWDKPNGVSMLEDPSLPIVRPANYTEQVPGRGWYTYTVGAFQVAVINLQGQVFFKNAPSNPFLALDELLKHPDIAQSHVVLVDFHTEATSEIRGMGWHADGRVSAVWGTHTHVPTADAQVLPKGTGYVSDIGMCGGLHSIIGMAPEGPLKTFKTQLKASYEPQTEGPVEVNALYVEVEPSGDTDNMGIVSDIAHIRKILND